MSSETLIALLGVTGGIVGFSVGLWQYRNAQRWKVLEFVAQEVKEFEKRAAVSNAMLMLDYEGMEIELFPEEEKPADRLVAVREPLLVASLVVEQERGFTNAEVAIRDIFDEFFGCLERFDQYIESGLVSYAAFHPYLKYWLGILAGRKPGLKSDRLASAVDEFLQAFDYNGVLRLLRRCREFEAAH